jgi:hypothetical protein
MANTVVCGTKSLLCMFSGYQQYGRRMLTMAKAAACALVPMPASHEKVLGWHREAAH